jgi:hypothetical protein
MDVKVTFTEDAIQTIELVSSVETEHVGTPAFDILSYDIIQANGTGVDNVSGATFTSAGFKAAINEAAEAAGASDLDGFKHNTIEYVADDPIDETYDVVVVGAGGAGMAAAAQAAQDGNTVLVIEENAEIGGNTLVSGGQYQSVMPYLCWEPENPDAKQGTKKLLHRQSPIILWNVLVLQRHNNKLYNTYLEKSRGEKKTVHPPTRRKKVGLDSGVLSYYNNSITERKGDSYESYEKFYYWRRP